MEAEKNRVTVTIGRKEYTIIADESTDYILSVANELNNRVAQIAGANASLTGEKAVILAALNLCDDYLKMRQTNSALQRQVMKCTKDMEKMQKASEKATEQAGEADEMRKQIVHYSEELRKAELELKRLRAQADKHNHASKNTEPQPVTQPVTEAKKTDDAGQEPDEPMQLTIDGALQAAEQNDRIKAEYEKKMKEMEEKHQKEIAQMKEAMDKKEKEILDMIDKM